MTILISYKTIIAKSEYLLADSIVFNMLNIVKIIILFIYALYSKITDEENAYVSAILFIWLAMILLSAFVYLVQIMLRARIIASQ